MAKTADEIIAGLVSDGCPVRSFDTSAIRRLCELRDAVATGVLPEHLRELCERLVVSHLHDVQTEISTRNPNHAMWRSSSRNR